MNDNKLKILLDRWRDEMNSKPAIHPLSPAPPLPVCTGPDF
jgi:hypothetical protein